MTPSNREETIVEFYPLVQTIARRLVHRLPDTVELDELVSVGMLGLIDAVDRYDSARGVPLKAYAEIRIKGAMLDSLRSNDWVPRSVRNKNNIIEQTRLDLTQLMGRGPTNHEIAERLEMSLDEFDKFTHRARVTKLLSLDLPLISDGDLLIEQIRGDLDDPEDNLSTSQLDDVVSEAIQRLSEKERIAVSMSYMEGYTLREIGGVLGVSESRVCQIRNKAMRLLRLRLAPAM